ncbi:hypothetical protein JTB14_006724 [Gonioctena quinquepunctata]|nr:hypothetical protein JTB14_006724 [Gonioctena quinquepunctata]
MNIMATVNFFPVPVKKARMTPEVAALQSKLRRLGEDSELFLAGSPGSSLDERPPSKDGGEDVIPILQEMHSAGSEREIMSVTSSVRHPSATPDVTQKSDATKPSRGVSVFDYDEDVDFIKQSLGYTYILTDEPYTTKYAPEVTEEHEKYPSRVTEEPGEEEYLSQVTEEPAGDGSPSEVTEEPGEKEYLSQVTEEPAGDGSPSEVTEEPGEEEYLLQVTEEPDEDEYPPQVMKDRDDEMLNRMDPTEMKIDSDVVSDDQTKETTLEIIEGTPMSCPYTVERIIEEETSSCSSRYRRKFCRYVEFIIPSKQGEIEGKVQFDSSNHEPFYKEGTHPKPARTPSGVAKHEIPSDMEEPHDVHELMIVKEPDPLSKIHSAKHSPKTCRYIEINVPPTRKNMLSKHETREE